MVVQEVSLGYGGSRVSHVLPRGSDPDWAIGTLSVSLSGQMSHRPDMNGTEWHTLRRKNANRPRRLQWGTLPRVRSADPVDSAK